MEGNLDLNSIRLPSNVATSSSDFSRDPASTVSNTFDASTLKSENVTASSALGAEFPSTPLPNFRDNFRRRRFWKHVPTVTDGRYDNFKAPTLDNFPRGYPRLAAFVNSDTNTHIYRRFGHVRNRLLLYLQDEVFCLEARLAALDEADYAKEPYHLASRSWDEEQNCERKNLIAKLKSKLKEYDELVLREHQMLSIASPSRKNHRNYFNHIWNEKPLCPEEYSFIYFQDDMISLGINDEDSWLEPLVEIITTWVPRKILKFLFASCADQDKTCSEESNYYSNDRMIFAIKVVFLLISIFLLILPVVLLYLLQLSPGLQTGIIVIFVAIFSMILLYMTSAKRHEIFVSVATYTAVLVVFLGNLGQS